MSVSIVALRNSVMLAPVSCRAASREACYSLSDPEGSGRQRNGMERGRFAPERSALEESTAAEREHGQNTDNLIFCWQRTYWKLLKDLAPRARFELATLRLTAECSTVELPGNIPIL